MILPAYYSRKEAEEMSLVTLEGRIKHQYTNYIPGVKPLMPGDHWLLENPKLVTVGCVSREIGADSVLLSVGFWTIRGTADINVGDNIRVSLIPHANADGFLTLMPVPVSRFALISADTGEPIGHCSSRPRSGAQDQYPYTWTFFPLSSDGWVDVDAWLAIRDIWLQAWPSAGPTVLFGFDDCLLNPCPRTGRHFHDISWRDSLPPVATYASVPIVARDGPVAVTIGVGESGEVFFNRSFTFTSGNALPMPNSRQFDLVSVGAHEMGHGLGLGHLNSSRQNLMFDSFEPEEVRRTLQAPDIDAITNIYG